MKTTQWIPALIVATLLGAAGTPAALANNPPTLNPLPDVTLNEDSGSHPIALSGIGPGAGEIQTLTLIATSSNPGLIPNPAITYASPNANGSLAITPVANASGVATITVIVNDGQPADNITVRSFNIVVNPVNDSPQISTIPNQIINENNSTGPIPFTVSDAETPASALIVAAASSNPTLVPAANIVLGGAGNNRTVTVIPAPNQFGIATITVTAVDAAGGTSSRSFNVTVNALVRIARAANDAMVSWSAANGVLQQRDESGVWEDMPQQTSPYRVPPSRLKLFRLRQR